MDQAWILSRSLPLKRLATCEIPQIVPSWSSVNSRLEEKVVRTEIGYCPLWSTSPTEYSTVYSVMVAVNDMMEHLEQRYAVITFDQANYKIAKEIQWKRPEQYKDTIIRLGGFHILLNFLGTVGKMCASAGLPQLITESSIYSETTTNSVIKGKQFSRGVHIHKLVHETLSRLQWDEFEQYVAGEGQVTMRQTFGTLEDLSIQVSDACRARSTFDW